MKIVNWRTTGAALASVAVVLAELAKLIDGDDKTQINIELLWLNLCVIFGLAAARDSKVTSEQAGAKPPGRGAE